MYVGDGEKIPTFWISKRSPKRDGKKFGTVQVQVQLGSLQQKKQKKTTKKLIDALYTPYDTQSTSMPYCNKHHSINSLHARRDNHLVSDKRMTQEFQAPVLTSLELFQTSLVLSP